jgi:hypothetical protein
MTRINMQNKKIIRIALATAILLLIPFVAMQFSDEVNWSGFDFVVAGALLFGSGLAYELVARKGSTNAYRAAVSVAVAAALLLAWVNLTVGIIGSEDNPAHLIYFGVIAVMILGAGTTGTTVNDMPQIELQLEIEAPGRYRYTITDRRCWNPLSLAGLQKGAKLPVLVDPRQPKKIMFPDEERA